MPFILDSPQDDEAQDQAKPATPLKIRIPPLSSLMFIDDEEDSPPRYKAGKTLFSSSPRKTAGSARVAKALQYQQAPVAIHIPGEVFHSISAMPGFEGRSFEELRHECYSQSIIATGSGPQPVFQPEMVIPPRYAPFLNEYDNGYPAPSADVIMPHVESFMAAPLASVASSTSLLSRTTVPGAGEDIGNPTKRVGTWTVAG